MFTGKKYKFLIVLVLLSLLVTLVPAGLAGAASAKCDTYYSVRRGDTLTSIGEKYDYAANQVVDASKLVKPYSIYVGQRLCIPDDENKDAPKIDSKYTNKAAAYFTAGRAGDNLAIHTFLYPKTKVLVKAGAAASTRAKYLNLGTQTVQGDQTFKVKLPSELKNVKNLQVCLKDRTTSYLQCVNVRP
jgi:hypothetical protein